jgi:hypothetical protein
MMRLQYGTMKNKIEAANLGWQIRKDMKSQILYTFFIKMSFRLIAS